MGTAAHPDEFQNVIPLLSCAAAEVFVGPKNAFDRLKEQTVDALARATYAAEPYTGKHMRGVAQIAETIAHTMDLGGRAQRYAYMGGLLHDVGKIGISKAVLTAPRKLTPEEFADVRKHPEIGAEIVYSVDLDLPIQEAVRNHHERWDGHGYPDGLRKDQIPLNARIVAVADTVHAMMKGRAYRDAVAVDRVVQELTNGADVQWDARIVNAAIPLIKSWA